MAMLAKPPSNRDVPAVKREDATSAPEAPPPLSGARLGVALVWLLAVVGVYLAVREFGLTLLH
jgi:hypothetical protein